MDDYEIFTNDFGKEFIRRLSDGAIIPADERNADYQEYLAARDGTRP